MRLKDSEKMFNVITRFLNENIHIESTETRQKIIKDISGMNTIFDVYKYPIQNHYLSDYETACEWVNMLFLLNFGSDKFGGSHKFDETDLNLTECFKEISVLYDGACDLYRNYLDDASSEKSDDSNEEVDEIDGIIMDAVDSSMDAVEASMEKHIGECFEKLTDELVSVVKKTIKSELKGR